MQSEFDGIQPNEDYYRQLKHILEQPMESSVFLKEEKCLDYKKLAEEQFLKCRFMNDCTASEIQYIFDHIKIRYYYQGQKIYSRHESCDEIFFILNGTVRMGWNSEGGKHTIHRFIPSGSILNIIYFISQTLLEHDYIAHEATVVAIIPGNVFKKILQQNPQVLYQTFEMICKRTRLLDNDIYHQSTQPLRIQLARQFVYLMEYFSSQYNDVIKLSIKLSQENFAELLKVSRQSIRKEILWFVSEGIIDTKYNQIYILDPDRLRKIDLLENSLELKYE
ncbi:Crp/Fnr family transcriptional regulator [Acinetobacter populi]|uniref:Transcriptional regulator n=1 Tax=Acinetobacter populi TaxID=1582270 RepID=A0A1Z9Z055_9GAMM|nr:Crp/Fnr family transcriptional regulator [Acinetobacter populi]OUY07853.1 transcriptional regulator [Acinetobacter populi]